MKLIKKYTIIFSLICSSTIHIFLLLYHQDHKKTNNDVIYIDLIPKTISTRVDVNNNLNTDSSKRNKNHTKIEKNIPDTNGFTKNKTKRNIKQYSKKTLDNNNKSDNKAQNYIKANYKLIKQQIVSNITYPPRAKKLGIEGSGYLLIEINSSGKIVSVKALDFPNKMLSEAALKAAKKAGDTYTHNFAGNIEIKIPISFYLH